MKGKLLRWWLIGASLILLQNYGFSQSKPKLDNWDMTVGLNWCSWAKVPTGVTLKPVRNYGFDVALLRRFTLVKHLKLGVGLGLSSVNIHNNVAHWEFDSSGKVPSSVLMNTSSYHRNKISLTYLEIPIELTLKLGEDKSAVRITAGFNSGILIDAHTKTVTSDATVKIKDTHNFNKWRYGPTFRFTLGKIGLYGRYDMSSTFNASKVPVYNVYSIGLIYSGS